LAVSVTVAPAATGSGESESEAIVGPVLSGVLVNSNLNPCPAGALPTEVLCVPTVGAVALRRHVPWTPAGARTRRKPVSGISTPGFSGTSQMKLLPPCGSCTPIRMTKTLDES
jgi:hypothetical protein